MFATFSWKLGCIPVFLSLKSRDSYTDPVNQWQKIRRFITLPPLKSILNNAKNSLWDGLNICKTELYVNTRGNPDQKSRSYEKSLFVISNLPSPTMFSAWGVLRRKRFVSGQDRLRSKPLITYCFTFSPRSLLSSNVHKYPPSFFESCGFALANHVGQQVAIPVCYFGVLSFIPEST